MNCKKIIAVGDSKLILAGENGGLRLPRAGEVTSDGTEGLFAFADCEAFHIDNADIPHHNGVEIRKCGLREAFGLIDHSEWEAAAKGAELVGWDKDTRFCAACGAGLNRNSEISKICPECGKEYFPVLNVAILVLVVKGEEALLVHARNFRSNFHALVAGFVETGETLEQCVAREVKEETNLEIADVTYFGSQSWPFPRQLMIGFTARYKAGEIRFADGELTSGGFFTRENHPPLPTPPSLSREIIDAWLNS